MARRFKKQLNKDFRTKVLEAVQKIPPGQVSTYKKIAILAGRPRAWRAVGNILKKNFNPLIPCHRVIRSDGKIGQYNRGAKMKKLLLKKEGYLKI